MMVYMADSQGMRSVMRTASTLPILMYHHVSPAEGSLTTTPARFAGQLRWLAEHGYRTVGAEEVRQFLSGQPLPDKSIVLTFDDGYLDNWVYAHPVLKEFGMKALLFVITGWVGTGPARASARPGAVSCRTPSHAECKQLAQRGETDAFMIRWSEAEAMQLAGTFEIHSHTHTHTRWDRTIADRAQRRSALAQDLHRSVEALKERLGVQSDHLCWPEGYFDEDYVEVAESLGFRHLYTTDPRGHNTPHADPRHLFRVSVKNRAGWVFGQRVWLARNQRWGGLYNRWKS